LSQIKSEFSKVLVAVDGSLSSMNAADRAIALAKKQRNGDNNNDNDNPQLLIALYVVFSRVAYAYSSSGIFGIDGLATPNAIRETMEGAKIEAQQWFDKIKEKINEDSNDNDSKIQLQTDVVVTATSIVSAIVEYAKHKNVDLIVIGSTGRRSMLKKIFLGSVASGL
jgi:nucleotide-binding universal stress UspA family protein